MRTNWLGWLVVFLVSTSISFAPAAEETIVISAPLPGDALQGVVTISGQMADSDFASAELSFAYSSQKLPKTWFPIQSFTQPGLAGKLASWDTSTITDGVYDLRLVVTLNDGTQKETVVPALRVRNYTPIETRTPSPTAVRIETLTQPSQTVTPTQTPIPATGTPLPTNPAGLHPTEFNISLLQGGAVALGLFALGGIYLGLKALFRR
jgi:hypothetical protein